MKKVLVVLLLCLVGFGFYRGWLNLSSNHDESNKVDVHLTVDPAKAKEDAEKLKDKTAELGDQAKDKVRSDHK